MCSVTERKYRFNGEPQQVVMIPVSDIEGMADVLAGWIAEEFQRNPSQLIGGSGATEYLRQHVAKHLRLENHDGFQFESTEITLLDRESPGFLLIPR